MLNSAPSIENSNADKRASAGDAGSGEEQERIGNGNGWLGWLDDGEGMGEGEYIEGESTSFCLISSFIAGMITTSSNWNSSSGMINNERPLGGGGARRHSLGGEIAMVGLILLRVWTTMRGHRLRVLGRTKVSSKSGWMGECGGLDRTGMELTCKHCSSGGASTQRLAINGHLAIVSCKNFSIPNEDTIAYLCHCAHLGCGSAACAVRVACVAYLRHSLPRPSI